MEHCNTCLERFFTEWVDGLKINQLEELKIFFMAASEDSLRGFFIGFIDQRINKYKELKKQEIEKELSGTDAICDDVIFPHLEYWGEKEELT